MKTLIALILLVTGCAFGGVPYIVNLNGVGTNTTIFSTSDLLHPLIVQGADGLAISDDAGVIHATISGAGFYLGNGNIVSTAGIFAGDGSGLTNLSGSTIITNNTFLTFINTNYFTNLFATNLTVVDTITTTTIKVTGKATFNNIVITNSVASHTNLWSGPTNTVDLNVYEQNYVTVTPFNFVGFVLPTNAPAGQIFLQIYNNASTNVTGTFPAALVVNAAGVPASTSVTVSNATVMGFWIHYTPQSFTGSAGRTNAVATQI